ncbi:hypothetical protein [Novipirellula herctigrandis]
MKLSETLPPPEMVAQQIANARRERELLRRLYRLSLDARAARRETEQNVHSPVDDRQEGERG